MHGTGAWKSTKRMTQVNSDKYEKMCTKLNSKGQIKCNLSKKSDESSSHRQENVLVFYIFIEKRSM